MSGRAAIFLLVCGLLAGIGQGKGSETVTSEPELEVEIEPSEACIQAIHQHKSGYFWMLFGNNLDQENVLGGEKILAQCGPAYGSRKKLEMMMYMRGVALVQSWSVEGKGVDCNRSLDGLIKLYYESQSNPVSASEQLKLAREETRRICKDRFRHANELNGFQYVLDEILVPNTASRTQETAF